MKLDNKKILVVAPHPDDEAIGCGGLLSKAKEKNCEIYVLYMCIGKCRQLVTKSTDENTRLKEMETVKKKIGFKHKVVYVGNEFMKLDTIAQKELIDGIEDAIEGFKPDIVCIPSPESYDQDHRATYDACITALRPIPQDIRHFVPVVLVYEEPYTWTVHGLLKPNFYLDLSGKEEKKLELVKLYKTQDRKPPFSRSRENLLNYMKIRGSEIGVQAAEAYHLLRGAFQ